MPRNPDKKQCKAKSKRSGEQCRNWAVPGYEVCYYHGAGGRPKKMPKRPATAHAPKGNTNSVKHGAYSARLLPEEQARYDQIKDSFLKELGGSNLSAADERLIHQLAAVSAKFDVALEKGAPPDALAQLSRLVMDHLRELKATRASKDNTGLTGNSPAEVVAALLMKVRAVDGPKQINALEHNPDVIDVEAKPVESDADGQKE